MKKIAVIVEKSRAYGRALCEGIADAAQKEDAWSLDWMDYSIFDTPERLRGYDGIIARLLDDRSAERIAKLKIPTVDVFCRRDYGIFGRADCDHAAIARKAAEHFAMTRFTKIAFCGFDGVHFSDARRKAFIEAVEDRIHVPVNCYSTPLKAIQEFNEKVIRNERLERCADERQLLKWIKSLPEHTAIFCCHDMRAYHVSRLCRENGISVPNERAILGADNDRLVCSFTTPMLSSIDIPAHRVGVAATAILSRMMREENARKNPPAIFVKPREIFRRKSTEVYDIEPKWLADAMLFIHKHLGENISAVDVVRFTGRSHTAVHTAFKKEFGEGAQKLIARMRLENAEELLQNTELPIKEIAKRSGFASLQYFCRMFKAVYKQSAEEYRNAR